MLRSRSIFLLAILAVAFWQGNSQQTTPPDAAKSQTDQKAVKPPSVISTVEAEFPQEAIASHKTGVCTVQIFVDIKGIPQEAKIVRCSDPIFEKNSLIAVEQYRFHPAVDQKGQPVGTQLRVVIEFSRYGEPILPRTRIKYALETPPGVTSSDADANGVYPFSNAIEQPKLTEFSDQEFSRSAESIPGEAGCMVLFTITDKGKAADPQILQCNGVSLEKPVINSLLQSHYKAGKVKGKNVSVRALIRVTFGGYQQ